jgi:TDG/mug DNA glycosylase family protein
LTIEQPDDGAAHSGAVAPRPRPTRAELEAARDRTIPDLVAPDLRVLFCGINPGLYTTAIGCHFGRPGNRFWKALALAGFTDRLLDPCEQELLLARGLGITNLVVRTTATAAELSTAELRAGAIRLRELVGRLRPRWLAMVGIDAYRVGFEAPDAVMGRQPDRLGDTGLWVLPNPSGLNAHYQLPALGEAFGELRRAAFEAP